jgi:hypothetical protein
MSYKIFISHASADKKIVDALVDHILIGAIGFKHQEIFYTSGEGMGVNSGADWRNSIRSNLLIVDVIFLIITPNYKSSEICLNEMGAAWTTDKVVLPVIIDPITYKTVGVLAEVNQVEKLNTSKGLDNICDELLKVFKNMSPPKQARWTVQKKKCLEDINSCLKNEPFPKPVTKESIITLEETVKDLAEQNEVLFDDNAELRKYIESLESKKDAVVILEARKESGQINSIEEFEDLIGEIQSILDTFDSSLITSIFNDYTCSELDIPYHIYKSDIERAKAKKFLDDDYQVSWHSKIMMQLSDKLSELSNYIEDLDEETYNALEVEYETLDIKNMTFWENVFEVKFVS